MFAGRTRLLKARDGGDRIPCDASNHECIANAGVDVAALEACVTECQHGRAERAAA